MRVGGFDGRVGQNRRQDLAIDESGKAIRQGVILETAPALSLGSTSSFCSPFCKICCYHVLELRDRALRKLAGSGEVLVQNVLRPPQQ